MSLPTSSSIRRSKRIAEKRYAAVESTSMTTPDLSAHADDHVKKSLQRHRDSRSDTAVKYGTPQIILTSHSEVSAPVIDHTEILSSQSKVLVPVTDNAGSVTNFSDLSPHSTTSRTSVVSKRHLLIARAARQKAEQEAARIEREREAHVREREAHVRLAHASDALEDRRTVAENALIEARLAEDLALLDIDAEVNEMSARVSVTSWLEQSARNSCCDSNILLPKPSQIKSPVMFPVKPTTQTMALLDESNQQQNDDEPRSRKTSERDCMAELTKAITNAVNVSSESKPAVGEKLLGRLSAKHLPTFSGDSLDWLRFKNAYVTTTNIGQYTEEENIARLQRSLQGDAWDAVAAQLITATSAEKIIKTLELRFGRPELVLNKLIGDMKKTPKLTGARSELVVLATKVSNCVAAIETVKHIGYLHSPELVSEVISKLTEVLVYRWLDYSANLNYDQPRLPALASYLMAEAERACNAGVIELPLKMSKPQNVIKRPVLLTTAESSTSDDELMSDDKLTHVNVVSEMSNKLKCTYCKSDNHTVQKCPVFTKMEVSKRWDWVCEQRLCFQCLLAKHQRDRCNYKKRCASCKARHHSLLHREDWGKTTSTANESTSTANECDKEITANLHDKKKKTVFLKVLPLELEGPNGIVSTYGLFDEGSSVTLIENETAKKIGATGPITTLDLQGAIGEGTKSRAAKVSFNIRSAEGTYRLDNVRTVDKLNMPLHTVEEDFISRFSHLKDIPLQAFKGRPTILIGHDYWDLIVTRELKEGKKNEPVASKTLLGWVLHGFTSSTTKIMPDFILHVRDQDDETLNDLVKDYFSLESIGIQHVEKVSLEDKRAMEILDTKSKRIENRWETGLLWRSDDVKLPSNRRNAEQRLKTIERKMKTDSSFATDYIKQMNNFLQSDYAKEVEEPITGERVWFLPHFGVRNPNKPEKLRLVFDAKSETKGVSLNTELLSGPDLLNSLLGVLFRFRERAVAVTGDIKEMFLQVKIVEEDRKAQSFLWREVDSDKPPRTYQMTSMTFGATSSPCTATYILRRNADEFASMYPRAVMAIKRRHYVDDYLDSADTEEEMKVIMEDVIMIHKSGGFDIRGWASNKPDILPRSHLEDNTVSILNKTNGIERTLGLHWKTSNDTLGFDFSLKKVNPDVVECRRSPTKREMLKVIMTIFDPLGLLSPILVRGKILLQEVWRSGLVWDETISEEQSRVWFNWLNDIKACKDFSIPRCYSFSATGQSFQIHVFVDASEQAYTAVAYLQRGQEVAFVAAKCRVAPLKLTTIPRLELQAALMGARLGSTVEKEIDFAIEKRYFWTDSKTVWLWIQKTPRQNQPFVLHRLAGIEEVTKPSEWKWLPGRLNVADEATRSDKLNKSKWIEGPDFLRLPEDQWPKLEPDGEESATELQEIVLAAIEWTPVIDMSRFSNWRRLLRTVAMALCFIDKCRKRGTHLTTDHMQRAERLILKQIQRDSFPEEIDAMAKYQEVRPTSRLRQFRPKFDKYGLLVVDSRIEAVKNVPPAMKAPVIIDGRHQVARLIINDKHKQLGHHSFETLLNELKQRYHILRLRVTARSIVTKCVVCRARRLHSEQPLMARLPPARLEHHCRPFSYCGIDLFGPINVTIGRRHEKRWGVLFTCLSIRAVHIELAASLTTDSAILAIRRMAARRGNPIQMYSDNGTNLRGADKELRKALQDIQQDDRLQEYTTERGIDWRFNPPDAAHMGGVWERLVRSIKVALNATLNSRAPNEEVLLTLLTEAENIVNSRPLTHVNLDPDEEEALTPNHFLLGSASSLQTPGTFTDEDLQLRKRWRIAQRLADKFWARWIREFLPSLHGRKKWTQGSQNNLSVGDIVLIADSTAPRNTWARGKISATVPGKDGRVRIVDVATRGGTLRRPASRIVVLLSEREQADTLPASRHPPDNNEEEIVADQETK